MAEFLNTTLTIKGDAETVLAELRRLRERNTERTVQLAVSARPPTMFLDWEHVPEIKNGESDNSVRHLKMMTNQTRISPQSESRFIRIVEEMGPYTLTNRRAR